MGHVCFETQFKTFNWKHFKIKLIHTNWVLFFLLLFVYCPCDSWCTILAKIINIQSIALKCFCMFIVYSNDVLIQTFKKLRLNLHGFLFLSHTYTYVNNNNGKFKSTESIFFFTLELMKMNYRKCWPQPVQCSIKYKLCKCSMILLSKWTVLNKSFNVGTDFFF